jgi:hypothetical protein
MTDHVAAALRGETDQGIIEINRAVAGKPVEYLVQFQCNYAHLSRVKKTTQLAG